LNAKNGNNEILTITLVCEIEGFPCELSGLNCVMVDDDNAAANNQSPYSNWFIQADFIYSEDCTLGITSQNNIYFSIYPNPVKDILYIENKTTNIENVTVYDVSGKVLTQKHSNTSQVNLENISSGLLFVILETNQGKFTKKVIKN